MIETDFQKCTGCGACVQSCPVKCISWQYGDFDFRYPKVNNSQCINCGKCEVVCPIEKKLPNSSNQHAYAFVHIDHEILRHSTSGGGFSLLADYVLTLGGTVYGCCMEDDFKVKHVRVTTSEELGKLRGSKYVQSDISDVFTQVRDDLRAGLQVLFTGTPCQVDGLYGYLGRSYDNLLTVDIVCHGVGSQAYFDKYLEQANAQYGDILEIRFRDKEFAGWSCGGGVVIAKDKKGNLRHLPYYDYNNYYYHYFLNSDIYRESCYSCKYANLNRVGDFTLGDFWGIEALNTELDTADGCSLLFTNTERASAVLKILNSRNLIEVAIEEAKKKNHQLNAPSQCSSTRERLLTEFLDLTAHEINQTFKRNHYRKILKLYIKSLIPYRVKRKLRKYM